MKVRFWAYILELNWESGFPNATIYFSIMGSKVKTFFSIYLWRADICRKGSNEASQSFRNLNKKYEHKGTQAVHENNHVEKSPMIVAAVFFIPYDPINENGSNKNAGCRNEQSNVFHWIWLHQKTKIITFIMSRHFCKNICHCCFCFFVVVVVAADNCLKRFPLNCTRFDFSNLRMLTD